MARRLIPRTEPKPFEGMVLDNDERLMTTAEVAAFMRISEWQVRYWRTRDVQGGPRYVKFGRHFVRYFRRDVIAYVRRHMVRGRKNG